MDLSKLNALEIPSEEIEVEIHGEKQKCTICAMGDDVPLDLPDNKRESTMRKHLLVSCAKLSEADADALCAKDGRAVAFIVGKILDLTDRFDEERKKIAEEAKKKAVTESPGTVTAG